MAAKRVVLGGSALMGSLVVYDAYNPGFRRSVQFWSTLGPTIIEYQSIKYIAQFEGEKGMKDLDRRLDEFHEKNAKKTLGIIISLGGIYVKLGQFLATMGSGLLMDCYIQALLPLTDGLPPRTLESIIEIIENDINEAVQTKKLVSMSPSSEGEGSQSFLPDLVGTGTDGRIKISDLFSKIEETPLGAASIAQVHKATLLDGREVVVKVQYPEVAANYIADFDNMETVAKLLQFTESLETIRALRVRHEYELDFRLEAQNLIKCGANAAKHGFSPKKVRLPAVIQEIPATQHVLVMEYLPGRSMSLAIEDEMTEIAKALGLKGGVKELRQQTMKAIKTHFRQGGGGNDTKGNIKNGEGALSNIIDSNEKEVLKSLESGSGGSDESAVILNSPVGKYLQQFVANHLQGSMQVLRAYVGFRKTVSNIGDVVFQFFSMLPFLGSFTGLLGFAESNDVKVDSANENKLGNKVESKVSSQATSESKTSDLKKKVKVNLDEKIRDMVQFHGHQLLFDGLFNADPHPGNILILPDGSLGLIDYGIVGCLTLEERLKVARVIVALANDDLEEAARIYLDSGYHIVEALTGKDRPAVLIGRIARFHLDKMDLSLVQLDSSSTDQRKTFDDTVATNAPKSSDSTPPTKPQSILRALRNSIELAVPDWVLQSRRLGGLLIGVSTQAGRPVSLAKEWEPLARKLLADHGQTPNTTKGQKLLK